MEPHPIPQNVTSFQFRLVGDMTLKQFLYLAAGCGLAYLLFVFLAPIYPLVAWPVIIISAASGVAFAFLPIGSRPLDYWLAAFLKAIYSPTKRIWKKSDKTFKDTALFNSRLVMYLSGLQTASTHSLREASLGGEQNQPILTPSTPAAAPPPPPPEPAKLPTQEELAKTVDLARQAQNLQLRIIQTERTLSQIKSEASQPTSIPIDYSQQVNKIMTDLQNLLVQASQIKEQLSGVNKPEIRETIKPKEKIKVVLPVKTKQTQLALTTFPNVINGIIKDKSGNYLEGVIAVIYDKEGLPVRALKTNKLGQFSGSTPLPNGPYTLELEKDNFTFDVLQIELGGEVLAPLVITAK